MSALSGLNTALRGLTAQQAALDVTGQNIANVETKGYTRQSAILTSSLPQTLPIPDATSTVQQIGQGVDVLALTRSRDLFLDLQARAAQLDLGNQQTSARALERTQSLLHEPGENGIGKLLDGFWTSWQTLSNQPESAAAKAAVLGKGKELAGALNQLRAGLGTLRTDAANELTQLTGATGPVQAALTEVAQLNGQIATQVQAGRQPNDLLDRRDLLLDQLSTFGQVGTTPGTNGQVDVTLDGQATVTGTTSTFPSPYVATTGKLGALATLNSASGPLAGYQADLDAVAGALISGVNGLQPTAFFSGSDASDIAVAGTASVVASAGAAGENDLAKQLAALRGGTADDRYAALVQRIGADTSAATRARSNAEAVATSADERRQSVAGVSLDEEMTNLIRFQRGYQAAARVMSTMDEALDTLINRTGRVGL